MISELVTLEYYFGRLEAVMTLDDLVKKFGSDDVYRAIRADEIEVLEEKWLDMSTTLEELSR